VIKAITSDTHQAEHDEIRVLAVHAVRGVGVIRRAFPQLPDALHDLVLPFPGHLIVGGGFI